MGSYGGGVKFLFPIIPSHHVGSEDALGLGRLGLGAGSGSLEYPIHKGVKHHQAEVDRSALLSLASSCFIGCKFAQDVPIWRRRLLAPTCFKITWSVRTDWGFRQVCPLVITDAG